MLHQHGPHDAHQDEHAADHVDDDAGEHLQHRFAVIGDAGHQAADGVVVEKADVQPGQVVEDVRAHIVHDLLSHRGQQRRLGIGEHHGEHHAEQIQPAQPKDAHQVLVPEVFQFRDGKALVGNADIFGQILVGGLSDELGLPQLQLNSAHDDDQHQQEPADIGLAVFQEAPHNVAVDDGVILFHAHNAYSSFFIFSSSWLWYISA